jgi:Phosphopantothenoylcysteine synthetase/decarboxylase
MNAIVLNSLREAGAGFGVDTNRVTLLMDNGNSIELPLSSKAQIAEGIINALIANR